MIPLKYPYVSLRWAFMRWADIPSAASPQTVYLRRLRIVQTPWWALYLHFIYEPDDDRFPHDHPANFWSLVLRGGYHEKVYYTPSMASNFYHGRFSLHKMPINQAHRITSLRPCTVTLVLFGRRQRDWGFWTDNGFVPYREYEK